MGYVDISSAVEFMKQLEKRKHGNACHNCGNDSLKGSDCNKSKMSKDTCHKCKEIGHRAQDCPKTLRPICKGMGHNVDDCTGPKTRPCRNGNEVGHLTEVCTAPVYRRVRSTLLHEASTEKFNGKGAESQVHDDVEEPESAPPTLPESWTNLDVKNPRGDPKDLANYLESTALGEADIVGDLHNDALGDSDAAVEELIADIAPRIAEWTDVQEEEWTAGMTAGVGGDGDGDGEDENEDEDVEFDEDAAIEH